jgi:hypothetical protein
MTRERRLDLYTDVLTHGRTVDGIYRLTPAQRRRVKHKHGHARRKEDNNES